MQYYYPFGMGMEGSWKDVTSTPDNRYTYNGKELQDDLGLDWLDYHARFYDPSIGRWGQIDPHAENYYSYSGYNYVINNPLIYIDPDGKDLVLTFDKDNVGEMVLAMLSFIENVNHGLEDQFSTSLTKTEGGGFKVGIGEGDASKLSSRAKEFHGELSNIIKDESVTSIELVHGSDIADVANFNFNLVDMADIDQFPSNEIGVENTVGTRQGKLMHELGEQYHKQKYGSAYKEAHAYGKSVESNVDGLTRVPFKAESNMYIFPNEYASRTRENAIGRNTKYHNPRTGTVYVERVLIDGRAVVKYLPPVKLK